MFGQQGAGRVHVAFERGIHDAPVFEREAALKRALDLFEAARKELGGEIEFLHDAHERYTPTQAVELCKQIFNGLPEPKDGFFTMPEAPGLGFEPNRDAIREIAKLPLSQGRGKG